MTYAEIFDALSELHKCGLSANYRYHEFSFYVSLGELFNKALFQRYPLPPELSALINTKDDLFILLNEYFESHDNIAHNETLQKFIDGLVKPFIIEQQVGGNKTAPQPSALLYHLYFHAAGYSINGSNVIAPTEIKTSTAIKQAMLDSGYFLDKNHLDMILAITGDTQMLALKAQADSGNILSPRQDSPHIEELRNLYRTYLNSTTNPFYHFYDENITTTRTWSSYPNISDEALCQWLKNCSLSQEKLREIFLHCAILGYNLSIQELLKKNISPNIYTADQLTPLMIACKSGYSDIAMALISAKAYLNARDSASQTALIHACQGGYSDIATALIKSGADVNARDQDGQTALMFACKRGYRDIVTTLIKAGADINHVKIQNIPEAIIEAFNNPRTLRDMPWLSFLFYSFDYKISQIHDFIEQKINLIDSKFLELYKFSLKKHVLSGIFLQAMHYLSLGVALTFALMPLTAYFMFKYSYRKITGNESPAEISEKAFIAAAQNPSCSKIDWKNLNVNRFMTSDSANALSIALDNNNHELIRLVLQQESLAPWVILSELQNKSDTLLPLVLEYPKFHDLLLLHKTSFSQAQQNIIEERLQHGNSDNNMSPGTATITTPGAITFSDAQRPTEESKKVASPY